MVNCIHWTDCSRKGGGCCALGAYDRPSVKVCLTVCKRRAPDPVRAFLAMPVQEIEPDYKPTPTNATKGGCGCKK
jgi:hypothetical protein